MPRLWQSMKRLVILAIVALSVGCSTLPQKLDRADRSAIKQYLGRGFTPVIASTESLRTLPGYSEHDKNELSELSQNGARIYLIHSPGKPPIEINAHGKENLALDVARVLAVRNGKILKTFSPQ